MCGLDGASGDVVDDVDHIGRVVRSDLLQVSTRSLLHSLLRLAFLASKPLDSGLEWSAPEQILSKKSGHLVPKASDVAFGSFEGHPCLEANEFTKRGAICRSSALRRTPPLLDLASARG